jgi:uncharacterized protein YerC
MRTRDAALIRKLCSLGLPPQTLAQSLLPALRQIIPAHSGGVFWVDHEFQMTGLYAERLLSPEAMATYYESHYRDAAEGFVAAFRERAARDDPVSSHSFDANEQGTPYFRDVLRVLDAYHVLYGVLRNDGRAVAQVSLYRGSRDEPFNKDDEAALRELASYLSRGLVERDRRTAVAAGTNVVDESLGIASRDGQVVCAAAEWSRLLRLAALQHVRPDRATRENEEVRHFLRELCSAAESKSEVTRSTPWGRFSFGLFLLEANGSDSNAQVGILIRREESRTVAWLRGAGNSSLSTQQREVALLLAEGKTNPEIADALGLSLNTASTSSRCTPGSM